MAVAVALNWGIPIHCWGFGGECKRNRCEKRDFLKPILCEILYVAESGVGPAGNLFPFLPLQVWTTTKERLNENIKALRWGNWSWSQAWRIDILRSQTPLCSKDMYETTQAWPAEWIEDKLLVDKKKKDSADPIRGQVDLARGRLCLSNYAAAALVIWSHPIQDCSLRATQHSNRYKGGKLMKRIVADMARIYLVERAYIIAQEREKIVTYLVKKTSKLLFLCIESRNAVDAKNGTANKAPFSFT